MGKSIELKDILLYIENDKTIKDVYKEVEEFEILNKGRAFHNYNHVINVMLISTNILKALKYDMDTIVSCKIACLLHDTGARYGKENHEIRSYEYAKNYFESHNWDFKNKDLILNAIKNHSNGFEYNDIISLTLIFADKLDIKKNRISEEGKKVVGNRQYSHIDDIHININNKTLIINFITDKKFNINEFYDYYFTKKVFKAIKFFANASCLKYKVLVNNCNIKNNNLHEIKI